MNFSEGLKIKVIVSDFNFRNIYPGICPGTFVKSDSNKLPNFRSSSVFRIEGAVLKGFFAPGIVC